MRRSKATQNDSSCGVQRDYYQRRNGPIFAPSVRSVYYIGASHYADLFLEHLLSPLYLPRGIMTHAEGSRLLAAMDEEHIEPCPLFSFCI
jgi:hypothetical protein